MFIKAKMKAQNSFDEDPLVDEEEIRTPAEVPMLERFLMFMHEPKLCNFTAKDSNKFF